MNFSLTDNDILEYVKAIDSKISITRDDSGLWLYYNGRDMGIGITGKLDNGTEWTLQTLSMEIKAFLEERICDKLIIAEERYETPRRERAGNSRRHSNRRKSKGNGSKNRL